MDVQLFKDIGLTPGEIKVYFTLLEKGSMATGEISKHSGVHTSKVYPILDRLIQKGIVSYVTKENVRYYQASDPQHFLQYVHEKKLNLEEQEERLQKVLPELMQRQKMFGKRQEALIYEGMKGMTTIFKIMLDEWKRGEPYYVLTSGEELNDEQILFFTKQQLLREQKHIPVQIVALETERGLYLKAYKESKYMRFRFTDFNLPAGINIVHNKVVTLVWNPVPTAFVIESEVVAERYKRFFRRLWAAAKP